MKIKDNHQFLFIKLLLSLDRENPKDKIFARFRRKNKLANPSPPPPPVCGMGYCLCMRKVDK